MKSQVRALIVVFCLLGVIYEVSLKSYVLSRNQILRSANYATDNVNIDQIITDNLDFSFTNDPLGMLYPPNDDNFDQDYDYPPEPQNKGTVRIPVFYYHNIAPLPNNHNTRDLYVSPEMLEQQLSYLRMKNYKSITPREFYDLLALGKNPTQKTVMLTFDDGNENNYQNAFPLLKKYGFIGVFYISTGHIGMTIAQIKEMSDAGMIIDSHGKYHLDLTKVSDPGTLYSEIVSSKYSLQSITGKTVESFAYPGCGYTGDAIGYAKSAGYILAFSCGKSIDHKMNQSFALSRLHPYNDLEDFKRKLSGIWIYPAGYNN